MAIRLSRGREKTRENVRQSLGDDEADKFVALYRGVRAVPHQRGRKLPRFVCDAEREAAQKRIEKLLRNRDCLHRLCISTVRYTVQSVLAAQHRARQQLRPLHLDDFGEHCAVLDPHKSAGIAQCRSILGRLSSDVLFPIQELRLPTMGHPDVHGAGINWICSSRVEQQ